MHLQQHNHTSAASCGDVIEANQPDIKRKGVLQGDGAASWLAVGQALTLPPEGGQTSGLCALQSTTCVTPALRLLKPIWACFAARQGLSARLVGQSR